MRSQDAVDTFRDALHLAESEAAIYVHLCMGGPAKAGDLAGALKLHRNEVYRNATRLLSRGIIEMTMERPARYAAVSPERVFENEVKLRLASIEELKHARDHVMPIMAELEAGSPTTHERRTVYKVVQGRAEIAAAQVAMIERAKRSIRWASTFPPSVPIAGFTGALDAMARRVQAGIHLQAAVRTNDRGWAMLETLGANPEAELREMDVDSDIRFLIVDDEELLMTVVNDPSDSVKSKDEVAIQTTASGFVQAETVFFDQVWAVAKRHP